MLNIQLLSVYVKIVLFFSRQKLSVIIRKTASSRKLRYVVLLLLDRKHCCTLPLVMDS